MRQLRLRWRDAEFCDITCRASHLLMLLLQSARCIAAQTVFYRPGSVLLGLDASNGGHGSECCICLSIYLSICRCVLRSGYVCMYVCMYLICLSSVVLCTPSVVKGRYPIGLVHHMTAPRKAAVDVELQLGGFFALTAPRLHPPSLTRSLATLPGWLRVSSWPSGTFSSLTELP